jgi:hypothetical protein
MKRIYRSGLKGLEERLAVARLEERSAFAELEERAAKQPLRKKAKVVTSSGALLLSSVIFSCTEKR